MGDEKVNPVQMPDEMVIEATANDGLIAANSKTTEEGGVVKLASPSSPKVASVNRPTKRRITPMAIDP